MNKRELLIYALKVKNNLTTPHSQIKEYKAKAVRIVSKKPCLIHADGRIFAATPASFRVIPNSLTVITGFGNGAEQPALKINKKP